MTLRRIVVVGNGIAGVTAADTLRAAGYDGELTLVGDETHPAYSRPALSKALLRDAADLTAHLAAAADPRRHRAARSPGHDGPGRRRPGRARSTTDTAALRRPGRGHRLPRPPARRRAAATRPSELTLRTLDDALAAAAQGGRAAPRWSSSAAARSAWRSPPAASTPAARSRSSPRARRWRSSSAPYLSGIFVSAALPRGLRIVTTEGGPPGRAPATAPASCWPTAPRCEAELVVTAVGDVPNVEWLASSGLLRHGAARWSTSAAGSGPTSSPPVTSPPSRRRTAYAASRCGARPSSRARSPPRRCSAGRPPRLAPRVPYFWTEQFGLSLKGVGHLPLRGEPDAARRRPGRGPGAAALGRRRDERPGGVPR